MAVAAQWLVAGLLLGFLGRRAVLAIASLLPRRPAERNTTRSITVLVAARNEAAHLSALFAALDRLDYPRESRHLILVSDGSTDETAVRIRAWAADRVGVTALVLPESRGKGGALAAGLAVAPATDLVVGLDADCGPAPDLLQLLSGAFDDPTVGAATAYPEPGNGNANLVTRYAALERWTHHLVTMAGKDRLALDPPITGVAFAVRRAALDAVGGFPIGRMAEDVELGMALTAAGWRLRWVREAVVREDVAADWPTFRQQRTRWGRGLLQSAPRIRTIEDLFVASGYFDRIVLVVAVAMVLWAGFPAWLPVAYVLAPAAAGGLALIRARARPLGTFLGSAVVMAGADIVVSIRTAVAQLVGAPIEWGRRT